MEDNTDNLETSTETVTDPQTESSAIESEDNKPVEEPKNEATGEERGETAESEGIRDEDPVGVKKRLGKLTAKNKALEEKLAHYEQQQFERHLQQTAVMDPTTGEPLVQPNRDDFEDARDYVDAKESYREKLAHADIQARQQAEHFKTRQVAVTNFEAKKELAREKYEDFDEVDQSISHNRHFPISDAMADVIYNSEHGADLFYWLGKHPADAERLYKSGPLQAARELGRLESQFAIPKKLQSKAPKPMPAERHAQQKVSKKFDNMSITELGNYLTGDEQ